jgi:hypothetical protein
MWVALENAGVSEVGTDLWSSPRRTADGDDDDDDDELLSKH